MLGGDGGADESNALAEQLAQMGAPPEVISQARRSASHARCQVFPENAEALKVWLAMETQWRGQSAGLLGARPQGLDYVALPVVFDFLGVADRAKVFRQLQIMEVAALAAMKELDGRE